MLCRQIVSQILQLVLSVILYRTREVRDGEETLSLSDEVREGGRRHLILITRRGFLARPPTHPALPVHQRSVGLRGTRVTTAATFSILVEKLGRKGVSDGGREAGSRGASLGEKREVC